MRTKVLVIGLDGASFNLVKPWAESGELPTLRKIMKSGTSAILKSTIPPDTPPAWTSIVTGKNPGKHGVFGFLDTKACFDEKSNNYSFNVINSTYRKSEAIWNVLSRKGRRVIVVNVPLTYPPERVNGIMISGFLTPKSNTHFTYPRNLKEEILKKGYEIGVQHGGKFKKESLKGLIEKKCNICLWLMENFDWDFFMIVFMETDQVQHFFGSNEPVVMEIYEEVDFAIEKILSNAPKNVTTFIISDHGFGKFSKIFNINAWLLQRGLLYLTKEAYNQIKVKKLVYSMSKIPLFGRTIQEAINFVTNFVMNPLGFGPQFPGSNIKAFFDHSKSKCFCTSIGTSYSGVKLNVKGREPKGIIESKSSYEELRNCIIRELNKLKDSDNQQLIGEVYKREDIYWGPFVDQAPDIVVETRRGITHISDMLFGDMTTCVINSMVYTHEMDGILMVRGPSIKRNTWLKSKVNVWDVAPTVLHIMDIPIPSDMDGRVLKEIFEHDSGLEKRPVVYEKVERMEERAYRWKEEEEEEVRRRLRLLGYM